MQKLELKKLQALLSEHNKLTGEFKRLEGMRDSLIHQENRLIETGDLESSDDTKKLGDIRLQLDLAPLRLNRQEKQLAAIDGSLRAEVRRLCSNCQTFLLTRYDQTTDRATGVLEPFFPAPDPHTVAGIVQRLPLLINMRARIDGYGMHGLDDGIEATVSAKGLLKMVAEDFPNVE
jgi:hypothetical protein